MDVMLFLRRHDHGSKEAGHGPEFLIKRVECTWVVENHLLEAIASKIPPVKKRIKRILFGNLILDCIMEDK